MPLGARKRAEEARAASQVTDEKTDGKETEEKATKSKEKTTSTEEEKSDDVESLRLQLEALRKSSDAEIAKLKEDLNAGRIELASLRRNHQTNLKRVEGERDMFAAALAKEQRRSGVPASQKGNVGKVGGLGGRSASKVDELEAQLRAARVRNGDLEEENVGLREENKQLLLRLQANKTLNAESGAYDKVVVDLVDVKLKLALAQEKCEEQTRTVKGLRDGNEMLKTANGDLEKSRQEWVVKCAEIEKEKDELQSEISMLKKQTETATKSGFPSPRLSSEMQQVPL